MDVIGNTTGLNSSLTKAQGNVAGFGSVAGKALGLTTLAIAAVGIAAVKAASDLTESLNKAEVVFGSAQKSVIDFSETSAESFGISQAAALEAASGFGAMAQSAGISERASADMSITLVKLAGDMASFNNQDPSEMLERLRSGLAGEAEPLRRFGVFISEARVQTEAYASGIAQAGEELTDAQKVQARFNIIMQDTAKQQGDFNRTLGESLPNQLRVLKAQLIDTAASLGQQLLPALLDIAQAVQDLLPVIKAVLDPLLQLVTLGAEAISVLAKVATLKFDELKSGITEQAEAAERLFMQYETGKITILELDNRLRQLREETGRNVAITEDYEVKIHQARDATARMKQAQMEWTQVQENAADTTSHLGRETDKLTDNMREQRLAVLGLTNSFVGILDQMDAVNDAQQRLNQLERHGKEDTKAYEEAVREAITAQAGLEEAVFQYAQELVDSGKSADTVKKKIKDLADDFGIQRDVVSELISRVQGYVNQLNHIPEDIHTQIVARFISEGQPIKPLGLQHGGTVTRTGLAEVHRGEVFSGVDNEMGFGGVTVTVNGWVGNDQELARKIRDELNKLGSRNSGTGLR